MSSVRRLVVSAPAASADRVPYRGRVVVVETLLILASVADLLGAQRPQWSLGFVVSVTAVASLLLRRRFPVLTMVLGLPGVLWGYALVAQLVATFTVAHRARDRRVAAGLLVVVAILQAAGLFWIDDAAAPTDYTAQGVVFAVLIVGGPAALGLLLRAYDSLRARLGELEASRHREHALLERSVLIRERTRLAREMHDVVSHQVSLIAVQAGALRMTAPDERTRGLAATLRELAVTTLTELRQMVGVLRESDAGAVKAELAPQPRLADLPALVDGSGLAVTLTAPPLRSVWPAPVQRAAYRTVQEGLTNARKHAPGAAVTVLVDDAGGPLVVEVGNGPSSVPAAVSLPGGGHGLIGLAERADLLEARLTHTPTPGGGFRLVLTVPPPGRG